MIGQHTQNIMQPQGMGESSLHVQEGGARGRPERTSGSGCYCRGYVCMTKVGESVVIIRCRFNNTWKTSSLSVNRLYHTTRTRREQLPAGHATTTIRPGLIHCPLKFLHALEIDQGLLAHNPTATGPPKIIAKI